MKSIAIGDKVRVLSSTEEGFVVNINKDIIEVEIEDGFAIPVLNKDLVVVSKSEKEYFGDNIDTPNDSIEEEAYIGIASGEVYAALVKSQKSSGYQLSLVNHTTDAILYHIYKKKGEHWNLLSSGQLQDLSYQNLDTLVSDDGSISISFTKLTNRINQLPKSYDSIFRIKPQWFIKELMTIPLIRAKGYYFPVGKKVSLVDTEKLKKAMFSVDVSESIVSHSPVKSIIDLHIEELSEQPEQFQKNQILPFQLETFDSYMDKAISAGNNELTVVHGVGNGTLKHHIQKKLSGHPHIAFFKDAQKEKFGYGAIYIKFK